MAIIDILITYLVAYRRGLLSQDKALMEAIEQLNELKATQDEIKWPDDIPGGIHDLLNHPDIKKYIQTGEKPDPPPLDKSTPKPP